MLRRALGGCQSATNVDKATELWYAQPAKEWMESLPVASGRLIFWILIVLSGIVCRQHARNCRLSGYVPTGLSANGLKISNKHIPTIGTLLICWRFILSLRLPHLAEGARRTIENRLAAADWEDTEWSRANMICFYARLKDARQAYKSVQLLEGKLSHENLMTVFPGGIAGAEGDIYSFGGKTVILSMF